MKITLPLTYILEYNFAEETIYKDGVPFFSTLIDKNKIPKGGIPLSYFDKLAEKQGGSWKIFINRPLKDETYVKVGKEWVLTKRGRGFA